MTPSTSSRPTLTADDYLLYLRCPRSLHQKLAGAASDEHRPGSGAADHDRRMDAGTRSSRTSNGNFAVRSDRDEIRDLAVKAHGDNAQHTGLRLDAPPFAATVDIWRHQNPEGMAALLAREGSGVKRDYLVDAAFTRYCSEACGAPLTRIFIMYVDKGYELGDELDASALFVTSDVTRRVAKIYDEHRSRLEQLAGEIAADPTLRAYRDRLCDRPYSCPVCSSDLEPREEDHVLTLYRGSELARELLAEGYTSIPEIPPERLIHPRQRIQQSAIETRRPHIDREALQAFLSELRYPTFYLDFEAVSSAVPRYCGSRPWEHVPYLYSVHTEHDASSEPEHTWYLMPPGEDTREQLVSSLVDALGEAGSVVVYSSAFEVAILRRLGEWFPARAESIERIVARVVDLLRPFSDFSFYHHAQKGKVSLKTVFPVLTSADYDSLDIQDGYTANIGYRYLFEHPDDTELARSLVEYCRMDTLAMVRIMAELRRLAE